MRLNSLHFFSATLPLLLLLLFSPNYVVSQETDVNRNSVSFSPTARTPDTKQGTAENSLEATEVPLAPSAISLTQSTDFVTVTSGNSVACHSGGSHTENSYYRRFDLDGEFGLFQTLQIDSVDIGIETAAGGSGSQPVEVRLYAIANADTLVLANLTPISSTSFSQADASLIVRNFPVTGTIEPSTDDLVVELFTPDGQAAGHSFFIGSNTLGQTAPSYIRAPDCGIPEPTDSAAIGFPLMHIVMIVHSGNSIPFPWPLFVPATTRGSK